MKKKQKISLSYSLKLWIYILLILQSCLFQRVQSVDHCAYASWRIQITSISLGGLETYISSMTLYDDNAILSVYGSIGAVSSNLGSIEGYENMFDNDSGSYIRFPTSGLPAVGNYMQFSCNPVCAVDKITIVQAGSNNIPGWKVMYKDPDTYLWVTKWNFAITGLSVTSESPDEFAGNCPTQPTPVPTMTPTLTPTCTPTTMPSITPSQAPSLPPSGQPSVQPSDRPSSEPSKVPSSEPSGQPTRQPSVQPSAQPTGLPSSQPSAQPSCEPSGQPTTMPSDQPSAQPSGKPSGQPTGQPSSEPSSQPSMSPSSQPTAQPSNQPSQQPSEQPSVQPTKQPSSDPTSQPTSQPSLEPSGQPSRQPSGQPSDQPSISPSVQPSNQPSVQPTVQPTAQPFGQPSGQPTTQPSGQPSTQPSGQPSRQPSVTPSENPLAQPSGQPTSQPSGQPSNQPSGQPSFQPSLQPTGQPSDQPSGQPSGQPSCAPSGQPSIQPSSKPSTQPSVEPSVQPSGQPSVQPTGQPSYQPSSRPSTQPSSEPTSQPSGQPSHQPTEQPSSQPSGQPSLQPTNQPSDQPSSQPSNQPSIQPSKQPTAQPSSQPSSQPSTQPSTQPSGQPVARPTGQPTNQPSGQPSIQPSGIPSVQPSAQPSVQPSDQPSDQPSGQPSLKPSDQPSSEPSGQPSEQPTRQPSAQPSVQPTAQPSTQPSGQPSLQPSAQPTVQPSFQPSLQPTGQPSGQPSGQPTGQPSCAPSGQPSIQPSSMPSAQPSDQPTTQPSNQPSVQPSTQPLGEPSKQPSTQPSGEPSKQPTSQPSVQPSTQPSDQPTTQPSNQPSVQPSTQPSGEPSKQPTSQPSVQPSTQPTNEPSGQPTAQPSGQPSTQPSGEPSTQPSAQPSAQPSDEPTGSPTVVPSGEPTRIPVTSVPTTPGMTNKPTLSPTLFPTLSPSYSWVSPPELKSCTLANDGSHFVAIFDIATDRGNLQRSHPCGDMFRFRGFSDALCVWQDYASLKVFPSGSGVQVSDDLIEIGDIIGVMNGKLRAKCPVLATAEECTKWLTSRYTSCSLVAPVSAVSPVVSISAPSVLSQCNNFTLDLSGSSGAGGRAWSSLTINVSSVSQSNSSLFFRREIEEFYRNDYVLSPPTALPAGYMMGNETYIFHITLCNFLLQCHTSSARVDILNINTLPIVTISGRRAREIRRSKLWSLSASAYIGTCNSTNRFSGMDLKWQVSEQGVVNPQLVSISKNPFMFKLPAESLTVGSTYVVTVIVIDSIYGGTSSANVVVTVVPSDLVAVIAGGAYQSWRVGEDVLMLDGSSSYDMDIGEGEESQGLTYYWSCDSNQSTIPTSGIFCEQLLPSSARPISVLQLDMKFMDFSGLVGSVIVLRLEVSGTFNRSHAAEVAIVVAESTSPQIYVVSSPKIVNNQQSTVKVLVSVDVSSASTGEWSLADTSIDLATISSIPSLSMEFPNPGTYAFNLVIGSGYLEPGLWYDFVLTVSSDQDLATTTVTVQVVEPPRSGHLTVSPPSGTEFVDYFAFSTSRWTDDELPLSYAFGYFKNGATANMLELQGRGESLFVNDKFLPRGTEANDYSLRCGVYAFNLLDARSVQTHLVKVLAVEATAEDLEKSVISQLEKVSDYQDINAVKSIVSVGVSILNAANCSLAPNNCEDLGRATCSGTPHTCGPCLEGYFGESTGDGNSACYLMSTQANTGDTETVAINGTCTEEADCKTMQSCEDGYCVYATKPCPSDCSGKGICRLQLKDSGSVVEECLLNDFSCRAKCVCRTGYFGSGCSESQSSMQAKRDTRYQLIASINATIRFEDLSVESLISQIVMLVDLSLNPPELTLESCSILQNIVMYILAGASEVDIPIDVLEDLLGVLDSCDQVYLSDDAQDVSRSRRRDDAKSSLDNNKVLRSSFSSLASKSMIVGERRKEFVDSLSRTVVSKDAASISASHAVPQTPLERFFVKPKSLLSVNGMLNDVVDVRSIFLEETDYSLYSNAADYAANPLKVQFVVSSSGSDISQNVLVVFQNNVPKEYITNTSNSDGDNSTASSVSRFVTECATKNYSFYAPVNASVFNYSCPDGQVISHRCTHAKQVLASSCPAVRFNPVCRVLASSDSDQTSTSCNLVSFTSTNVTCNCSFFLQQTSALRGDSGRLLSGSSTVESTGYVEMAAMTEYTYEGFINTNSDVTGLTVADISNGVVVVIMFASLWGCGVLGLYELVSTSYCNCYSKVEPKKKTGHHRATARNVQDLSLGAKREYLMKYVDTIIPILFRNNVKEDGALAALWKTIRIYHPYSVVFTAEGRESKEIKIQKGLYLLTIQAMLMFIMALFCDFQFPEDDGTCSYYASPDDCLMEKSMFDSTQSTCAWVQNESLCVYREVEFTLRAIMMISVLIACATAPINILVDFLFNEIISAPLADEYKVELQTRELRQRVGYRMSQVRQRTGKVLRQTLTLARGAFSVAPSTHSHPKRGELKRSLSSRLSLNIMDTFTVPDAVMRKVPPAVVNSYISTAYVLKDAFEAQRARSESYDSAESGLVRNADMNSFGDFSSKLFKQYDCLSGEMKREFVERWGLEESTGGSHGAMYPDLVVPSGIGCSKRHVSRQVTISRTLDETKQISGHKISKLRMASDIQVGLEVMHLFVIDLLGKNTPAAKIFHTLTCEEFKHSMVVTKAAKRVAWLTVIAINIYFVYFSVLRGITRSTSWQKDYVLVCVAELLVEVIVFETIECLWIHFMLPSLVRDDVAATMKTVKQSIHQAFEKDKAAAPLNSPKFFFPSHQLASKYPQLFESSVVLAFRSYFPPPDLDVKLKQRQVGKGVMGDGSVPVSGGGTTKASVVSIVMKWLNLSIIVLLVCQHLGTTHIRLQKVVVHTLQPIALSFIAILYFYFMDHPEMILVPVSLAVLQVLIYSCRPPQERHAPAQKPLSAMNDMSLHLKVDNDVSSGRQSSKYDFIFNAGVVKGVKVVPEASPSLSRFLMDSEYDGEGSDVEKQLDTCSVVPMATSTSNINIPYQVKPQTNVLDGLVGSMGISDSSDSDNGSDSDSDVDSSDSDNDNDSNVDSGVDSDYYSDSDSYDSSDSEAVVCHREFSEKKHKLLQWKVRRATSAVKDYCLANNLKKAVDYEFHWSESSDEYNYLYRPAITPFVNMQGKSVSMYQIIAKRNAMMLQDYASFKRNGELAAKGLERRKVLEVEWDKYRLFKSETILPFIDHTGRKVSAKEILAEREQKASGEDNSEKRESGSAHIKRKLDLLQRKQQAAEYQLLLNTEGRAATPPNSKIKPEFKAPAKVEKRLNAVRNNAVEDHCFGEPIQNNGRDKSEIVDDNKLKLQKPCKDSMEKIEFTLRKHDTTREKNEDIDTPYDMRVHLKSAGQSFLVKYGEMLRDIGVDPSSSSSSSLNCSDNNDSEEDDSP